VRTSLAIMRDADEMGEEKDEKKNFFARWHY
jgi:hypothetical protein